MKLNEGENLGEAGPEEHDAGAGWEAIPALLAGLQPENVQALQAARALELAYPLLHALTRGTLRDFFIRVATLESLVADQRPRFSPLELADALYWLKDQARETVVRLLRTSGWLTFEPEGGYRLTEHAFFVANVLSFLRGTVRDLRPTVEGIDYMLKMGVDPVHQVLLLRSQLEELRQQMEDARRSHSEVILRGAVARLGQALSLSERIRAIRARIPLDMVETRRVAQEIHDLLSRLHGVGSDLHAAITEVGRQYLHLVGGLTTADIVATLMRMPADDLAAAGRDALLPVLRAPTLMVPEVLAAVAENYLMREHEESIPVTWDDPPESEAPPSTSALPAEAARLLDDLDLLSSERRSAPLREVIPRGEPGESFLRASLLPLLGQNAGGEGMAGRLGAMLIELHVGDGGLEPAPPPLTSLSTGDVRPKTVADDG